MIRNMCHVFLGVLIILTQSGVAVGVGLEDDIRAELTEAQQEIKQLREEMAQLRASFVWQYQSEMKTALENIPTAAKDEGVSGLILPAGWRIKPYGYFKFDMSYDDSSVNSGEFIVWANPEDKITRGDDKFSATVRQTRLGAKLFAPNIGDVEVMGRIEVGFYNPEINVGNKPTPMLRHAYGQLTGKDWSFIFGQTSDVISPLVPDTINYTVGWFGGNVGYRHPQLRFTKWWDCGNGNQLKVETAVSRQFRQDSDLFGVDDGQDASAPTVLGRVSYATPMSGKKLVAGISGHCGKEEVDWDYIGDDDEVHSWSLNADLVVPVCDTVELKGEVFWAENFDSFFGGIGQGVNSVTRDEIEAMGAWAQFGYTPCEDWAFYGGAGFDDPQDHDLNTGDRSRNFFAFTNANYYFSKYLSTGLELSYWRTDYKNSDDGDDFRVQHSWKLSF